MNGQRAKVSFDFCFLFSGPSIAQVSRLGAVRLHLHSSLPLPVLSPFSDRVQTSLFGPSGSGEFAEGSGTLAWFARFIAYSLAPRDNHRSTAVT